jgi:cation diffusion facilitator family transporter
MGHHHHHHHHDHGHDHGPEDHEKRAVAFYSVLAAFLLTGTKLAIGWWTDSLGIVAEAMHSGLDLVATVVTLWAVRASGRPADAEHSYGHGKIENLSALFETVLLLGTCAWVIKEAIERLFFQALVHVDANIWAFLVVILSIAIDFSRSRALMKVAKKHGSQALEADALHFATDIWSSLVVLFGLVCVLVGHELGIPWLAKADAVAALGVAGVVVVVSLRLGKASIADLLDSVPAELSRRVATVAKIPEVREVKNVRVRRSGPGLFIDLTLVVEAGESLDRGHGLADKVESAIKAAFARADVVVHVEPAPMSTVDMSSSARRLAERHGSSAHDIRVFEQNGQSIMELHLEMPESLPLGEAHQRASALENDLRATLPSLSHVITHIEPAEAPAFTRDAEPAEVERIRQCLMGFPELAGMGISIHDLSVRRTEDALSISCHCTLAATTSIKDAHAFTQRIEQFLRTEIPGLGRVIVHTEPPGEHQL